MRILGLFDKTGALGALTAAMGCASCFPALGSLGAGLGLGFLAHYEGVFINTLLPLFAWIALAANVLAFLSHRIWYRALAGVAGPSMVLLTLFPLWAYSWSTYLLYAGIALMLMVSIWDIFSPPGGRHCAVPDALSGEEGACRR
ncbi:MAG TPA: organomercurial transporter MerC [Gammaproteobacteria bacterium]|nr:organomercurial transporter MerC [Gammaproteobacteria bacterium]